MSTPKKTEKTMTQKQLLEHISKGFESINRGMRNFDLRLAAVSGERQSTPAIKPSSSLEGDFVLSGLITSFDMSADINATSKKEFEIKLMQLMRQYKVFKLDISLNKRF